jgi:hypothetical protein
MSGTVRSRHTIRKNPPGNRAPRYVEPWTLPEAKDGTQLAVGLQIQNHAFRST